MQTLWSRLASSTRLSCRCPSCVSHSSTLAGGITRRPITAAGQRPKYAYSSTLFYSGIFAAAATTDAAVKQRRRERWDKAIGEMRQEIGEEEHELGEEAQLDEERVRSGGEQSVTGYQSLGVRDDIAQEQEQEAELEALFENERFESRTGRPIWPTNTGLPLIRHNLPPQSEYASQHTRDRALRRRWTPKKLRTTELSVDRLILRLILYLDETNQLEDTLSIAPDSFLPLLQTPRPQLEHYLQATEDRLLDIRHADPWLTTHSTKGDSFDFTTPIHSHSTHYSQSTTSDSHLTTSSNLHESLTTIFRAHRSALREKQYTLPITLIKICHNLCISPAPPLLNVWNTLLENLTSSQFNTQKPAEFVIETIRSSHVRLNEDTMIAVLNHCVKSDKSHTFTKWVGLMKGEFNGLALARPDINITESGGASRLIRVGDDKVVQNPYPTPRVFEALIKGVLHFAGFEAALRICRDMGFSGWGLSIRGLVPLLKDCVVRGDWESGDGVWRQIMLLRAKSRRDGRAERVPLKAYVEVLKMQAQMGAEYEVLWGYVGQAVKDGWKKGELVEKFEREKGVKDVLRRVILAENFGAVETMEKERKQKAKRGMRAERKRSVGREQLPIDGVEDTFSDPSVQDTRRGSTHQHVDTPQTTPSQVDVDEAAEPTETWRPLSAAVPLAPQPVVLEREHLVGDMAATYDLDDYEARERPMKLSERY